MAALAQAFQDAFSTLALTLAAVTTLTAIVAFTFLARGSDADADAGGEAKLCQTLA